MQQPFTKTGGARIGWLNATWPLAQLAATRDKLTVTAHLLGCYTFNPEQVSSVERYVLIPVLAWGVRVRHCVAEYPQRIIFWSLGNPDELLAGIRDVGFTPSASASAIVPRRGIPVRWSAIITSVVIWNVLFILPFVGRRQTASAPDWPLLVPLLTVVGLSLGIPYSPRLQRLILKPGRSVGEIRPFLRFLAFVCGLLFVIFSVLLATGAFKQTPNLSAGDANEAVPINI